MKQRRKFFRNKINNENFKKKLKKTSQKKNFQIIRILDS